MTDISTDHGSVLPAGSSALVVSEDGELSFFMSDRIDEDRVPNPVLLLVAVLLRSRDPEWVAEMIDSIDDRRES